MNIKSRQACATLGALVMASATPAFAAVPTILDPGGSVAVPDFVDGLALVAAKTQDFGGGPGPAGTLTEFVATDSFVNPFGFHALVFAFSLSLSKGNVVEISLPGYAGYDTAVKSCNATACIEGTGDPPDLATRSADGNLVSFLFSTPLTDKSSGFVVYTNAFGFVDPPGAAIFDSAGNVSFASIFLPAGVAEPSAWVTMLLGFAAAGAVLRRRSAAALRETLAS